MYKFPIGVMMESFCKPIDESLDIAAKMGAEGIQMYAIDNYCAEKLSTANRKELFKKLTDRGLVFSAICGDFGHGFGYPELNDELVERSKRTLDLALELGTNIVTTHIGVVPDDVNHPRYKIMQEACFKIAEYANANKGFFAVETGPESADVLKGFLDSLGSKGVSVNFDPANLVMIKNENVVKAVHTLKDYIVHTHAKDGKFYKPCIPEYTYNVVRDIPAGYTTEGCCEEVALGTGGVPYKEYLQALDDIGYKGFLTIEREVGANPTADIQIAYDFLKKLEEE